MAISGIQKQLGDFLLQRKQYTIPRYQRGYVWEEKQWKELFEDLKSNYEKLTGDGHFIGSIVIYDKVEDDYTKSSIIDGQQRITTLFLLLLAIMRKANIDGNKALFSGMRNYVKAQTPSGVQYDKFVNEHNPYFKEVLDKCAEWHDDKSIIEKNEDIIKKSYAFEEKFIKTAFVFLFDLLCDSGESGLNLQKFADKVMTTIVIETSSTDIKESYIVFEILNARGRPLENFELIKNYIMRNYESDTTPDKAVVEWNTLADLLTKNKVLLKDFFDHYVSYKYKKDFDKKAKERKTTYDYIKLNNKINQADKLMHDLLDMSNIYVIFNNPTKNLDMSQAEASLTILSSLLFFKGRAKKQFRPLFLALFNELYCPNETDAEKKKEKYGKLAKIMYFLEEFYFVYGIVLRGPTRQFERMVHEAAYSISSAAVDDKEMQINKMMETFADILPDYITFENAFCNLGYSRKNIRYGEEEGNKDDIKYILTKYEQHLRGNNMAIESFSIEHIYKDTGKDIYCKLGNLVCLEENLNSELGNKMVKTKIPYYRTSIFASAKKVAAEYQDIWQEVQINARGKEISQEMYKPIWDYKKIEDSDKR